MVIESAPLQLGISPAWASCWGDDRFGVFADVEVQGVAYRFRWVPPGEFTMGSPKTEAGRDVFDMDEHVVQISSGFWLGETPVTQAFWRAVTGATPSHFKGEDQRPVEQVSFADCRAMVTQLNGLVAGLAARLPREAEWEYACRAGTDAATYGGNLTLTDGGTKAPELEPIAWYGANSGRETHPVGLKLPNAWGFYDMLGNVYEWCDDRLLKGFALRVFRGGAWFSLARHVRAAYRYGGAFDPGDRFHLVGVRLSRGHGLGAPGDSAEPRPTV